MCPLTAPFDFRLNPCLAAVLSSRAPVHLSMRNPDYCVVCSRGVKAVQGWQDRARSWGASQNLLYISYASNTVWNDTHYVDRNVNRYRYADVTKVITASVMCVAVMQLFSTRGVNKSTWKQQKINKCSVHDGHQTIDVCTVVNKVVALYIHRCFDVYDVTFMIQHLKYVFYCSGSAKICKNSVRMILNVFSVCSVLLRFNIFKLLSIPFNINICRMLLM